MHDKISENMKRLIKSIVVLAIIAGVMLFTCPNEEKHVDKLTREIMESIQEGKTYGNESSILENLGHSVINSISEKLVNVYVKSQLEVENYSIFNVGNLFYGGEKHVVTIGAFNHVFCFVKTYELVEEIK